LPLFCPERIHLTVPESSNRTQSSGLTIKVIHLIKGPEASATQQIIMPTSLWLSAPGVGSEYPVIRFAAPDIQLINTRSCSATLPYRTAIYSLKISFRWPTSSHFIVGSKAFSTTSFNTLFSRLRSANIYLRRRFSSSTSFIFLISAASIPIYSAFQL